MTENWQDAAHVTKLRLDRICIFDIVIFTFLPFSDATEFGNSKEARTKDSGYSNPLRNRLILLCAASQQYYTPI